MTNQEIIEKINDLKKKIHPSCLNFYIKNHYPELFQELELKTQNLNKFKIINSKTQKLQDISIYERIFYIEHNLQDRPKCKVCGKNYVRFIKEKRQYANWCSISCACKDKSTIEKTKQTKLEKYGNENFVNTEKAKLTRESKNNGKWHNDTFSEKVKQTKLEKYGNENFVNQNKAKQTKLEKYGNENFNNIEKIEKTKSIKYGNPTYNNREKFKKTISAFNDIKIENIKNKRETTNLNNFGVKYPMQSTLIKEHAKNTCLEKYGVENWFETETSRNLHKTKCKELVWKRILSDKMYSPAFTYDEFLNKNTNSIWKWKCNKCGNIFEALYDNGKHHRCYKCWPNTSNGTSLSEQQIAEYIKSLIKHEVYNRCMQNKHVLNNKEIDIWIPDLKIAIEYDGLFYHSEEQGKGKNYHLQKTEECEKQGIQLIHIFEDEWLDKQKIVKSRLKHLIVNNERKIFARKCIVKEIDNALKDKFLNKYHIQGKDIAKTRLGLFYNNHLIAVMTFTKSRFNKKYEYELSRYATISNFTIIGGAGKLLKYFERNFNPKSIVTYADRRWSKGNLYFKLGFKLDHISTPNYFYVKNQHRFSRIQFQKHKLENILENFNPNLSEAQNMKNNGYGKIYDCGNLVFEKTYEK